MFIFKILSQSPTSPDPKRVRLSFALKAVYQRIYGCDPEELHEAEADVKTLLLSAIAMPNEFMEAVDSNAKPFALIDKKWWILMKSIFLTQ